MTPMKKYFVFLTTAILLSCVIGFSSCDPKGPDESEVNPNLALLTAATWRVNDVTVDGVNQNSLFDGFTLKFNNGTFTSTNGAPVWPASGTWSFDSGSNTNITRGDGKALTITSINASTLVFTLEWDETTFEGGRSSSISGAHVFTLTK
jgi:hypothetical protein